MNSREKKIIGVLLAILIAVPVGAAWFFEGYSNWIFLSIGILLAAEAALFLPFRIHGYGAFLHAAVTIFLCFFLLEFFTHDPWEMELLPQLLNILVVSLLFGFQLMATGEAGWGLFITALICLLVGVANYYTLAFRDSPILPWDLLSVRVALSVTNNYTFSVTWREANTIAAFFALMTFAFRNKASIRRWQIRVGAALLCVLSLFGVKTAMCVPAITDRVLTFSNLFTQWATYRDNGFFISFFTNLQYLDIKEPEGYSREKADAIVEAGAREYDKAHPVETSSETEQKPDVIVIMNEAFSDLSVLADFGVSEDYMPFFHSLMESDEAITGEMYVSVLGGNTANTEFEFLTGGSMAFLPSGSVPYQQYINDELPSIVRSFHAAGYDTFATHPYNASGWDRDEVYPFLGFDEAYFRPDFEHVRIIRKYVSDESQYEKIQELTDQKENPVFSFNVTMQNHGGYTKLYESFPIRVRLTDIEDHEATEHYLTLIQEADKALENLVKEYQDADRPTMIVFFGDHQPSDFVAKCIQTGADMDPEALPFEEEQNRYIVPYLIWANYPLEETEVSLTSANFFGAVTAKEAGTPLTDYEKYLLNLQTKIPVITANAYMGQDGSLHPIKEMRPEEEDLLQEYEMVCYRYLFDWEQ